MFVLGDITLHVVVLQRLTRPIIIDVELRLELTELDVLHRSEFFLYINKVGINCLIPGFSVTAPWAFICLLDGNVNKVVISIVVTNGIFFLINAHGVLRRMGADTEIPGMIKFYTIFSLIMARCTGEICS